MENAELATTKGMKINAYRNQLSPEEMKEYLAEYPDMARDVVAECPEHRLLALRVDGCALKAIKKSEQTLEEALVAVTQSGHALKYVSKRILKNNQGIYMFAIKNDGMALCYVPPAYGYEGMYEDAVRSNPAAIEVIPAEKLTQDLLVLAVQTDGLALRVVPKRRVTQRMARAAVSSNARAIEYVPPRFIDREMAMSAVSSCGNLLRYVPSKLVDTEMAETAVEKDGHALGDVPKRLITEHMCKVAVEQDPMCMRHVPPRFSGGLAYEAVSADWHAIQYVSKPSDETLSEAFEQSPLALEYFPNRKKTIDICESACARDPRAIRFVPRKLVSPNMLRNWLSSFFDEEGEKVASPVLDDMKALQNVDKSLLRDPEVATLMRRLGRRETKSGKWVSKDSTFIVTEVIICGWERLYSGPPYYTPTEKRKVTFNLTSRARGLDELSDLLGGDFSQVDFRDYPFDDYDPSRHDLSSSDIPVEILKRLGAYDDSAYRKLVAAWGGKPEIHNPQEDTSLARAVRSEVVPMRFDSATPFYYVSDLHLNHMLKNRFPEGGTERMIREFLADVATRMAQTAPESERDSPLLVLGDTSYNIDVAEIFFKALKRSWSGMIACVLGNHELWDWSVQGPLGRHTPTIDMVVDKYRDMLSDLNIRLLHNEALAFLRSKKPYRIKKWEFDQMEDDALAELIYHSSYVILGGIGFSGLCDTFNAEHGIYRDVVTSREKDTELSEEFSSMHERVRRLAPDANVIVATHTPMSNWSSLGYQPGWVYVSGHTHRNEFVEEGDVRAYADNQIGYRSQSAGLMRFFVEGRYDPFRHLPDGIHEVSRMDYRDFNRSRNIDIESFTRKGQILMLKREPVYLFLFNWEHTHDTYLLSGGRISSIREQNPKYYYEHMVPYVNLVKAAFSSYMDAIGTISEEVRSFGGEGRVHGCIVDIDFFNHVYLDPFTGRLKFYYATSVVDRLEYGRLDTLLAKHVPMLLAPYREISKETFAYGKPLVVRGEEQAVAKIAHKTDTLMYRPSNVVRSVQYLFDTNVIRVWNEDVFAHADETKAKQLHGAGERKLGRALEP